MPALKGPQFEELTIALSVTMSEFELANIVYAATGDRLYDAYVSRLLPLRQQIAGVLEALEKEGTLPLFLGEVRTRKRFRPDLQDLIARLVPEAVRGLTGPIASLSLQHGGRYEENAPERAAAPGLQRNVRPGLGKLDARRWLEVGAATERRVCRIERDGRPLGTGFLVGRAAVLTNYHVVKAAIEAGTVAGLACRFDYAVRVDGTREEGQVVAVDAAAPLDWSPFAPAEATVTPDEPPPQPDQLDYALMPLTEPAGEARGWITLPDTDVVLARDAPLMILQHPDGAPLKLALDTQSVLCTAAGGLRLRYRTNTEPGSSGSPCFTMDWDLAALHHLGDPAWRKVPEYNQGIPAALIRRRLADGPAAAFVG